MSNREMNPLKRLKAITDITKNSGIKTTKAVKKADNKKTGTGKSDSSKNSKSAKSSKSVKTEKTAAQETKKNKATKQQTKQQPKQTSKQQNKQTKTVAKQSAKQQAKQKSKQQNKQETKQQVKQQPKQQAKQETRQTVKQEKQPKAVKQNKKSKTLETVKIIPLGGQEQIGMNITAIEYADTIVVIDCGIAFPTEDMPGIDLVIPDVSYLKDNFAKVKAFCITHGHEDHIGALPYILKQLNVPVYATRLTAALIDHKLEEAGIKESSKLRIVKHGDVIKLGDFQVEFVKTNHSIVDACALAIHTPAGVIFHTGDFKVDYTPVFGEPADLHRMAEIGKDGCLALLCDSTNAVKPGFTMSERVVGKRFEEIFAQHKDNRIIVASFASNVDRVQQVINTAYHFGRKVVLEGRSMIQVITTAQDLGYINIPEGTLIDIAQLGNYSPENTVIITTGSQGESMAALSRMASNSHKKVAITENDVVIMSSKPIPGNEKAVGKVINELCMKGAEVILSDTHVSGHGCEEDIKLIYALLKPKYAFPVHGEYRHLVAQKNIAMSMGVPEENIIIMQSGDVVEVNAASCRKLEEPVQAGAIMVDGLGVGDVGSVVLKDRQNLAQNGIIIVTAAVDSVTRQIVAGPDIITRGFIYVKEAEDMMEEARKTVTETLENLLDEGAEWPKIRSGVRESISSYMWKRMKRNPIVIPVIMAV